MSKEGQLKSTSIFNSTQEELLQALLKKNKY
jgi:hypothetical protein